MPVFLQFSGWRRRAWCWTLQYRSWSTFAKWRVVGEVGLEPWDPMGNIYYGSMQLSCYLVSASRRSLLFYREGRPRGNLIERKVSWVVDFILSRTRLWLRPDRKNFIVLLLYDSLKSRYRYSVHFIRIHFFTKNFHTLVSSCCKLLNSIINFPKLNFTW